LIEIYFGKPVARARRYAWLGTWFKRLLVAGSSVMEWDEATQHRRRRLRSWLQDFAAHSSLTDDEYLA
jgi:hypothetical protein